MLMSLTKTFQAVSVAVQKHPGDLIHPICKDVGIIRCNDPSNDERVQAKAYSAPMQVLSCQKPSLMYSLEKHTSC